MRHATLLAALVGGLLLPASGAEARRVAIDIDNAIFAESFGCSLFGDLCGVTQTLPYFVDFGSGETNQVLFREDGLVQFVGDRLPGAGPDDVVQFDVLAEVNAGQDDNLGTMFDHLVHFNISAPTIFANWFFCTGSQDCGSWRYELTMTRATDGFDVVVVYRDDIGFFPELPVGWKTKTDQFTQVINPYDGATRFFLPATFRDPGPAIPEPATWALMLAGFGLAGAALRGRARRAVRPA